MEEFETHELGDVKLQGGMTLRNAVIAYKTYGELNADKSNVVVYPTWYRYDLIHLDPRGAAPCVQFEQSSWLSTWSPCVGAVLPLRLTLLRLELRNALAFFFGANPKPGTDF